MPWYVLNTKANAEQKALGNLEAQNFSCFLPQVQMEKLSCGKRIVRVEPLFPRYMFVDLCENSSFHRVRNTRGVQDFVRFGQKPAILDSTVVESIKKRCGVRGVTTNHSVPKEHDRVEILHGPYRNLEAIFHCSDGEERSVVLLSLLQSQVMLKVDNKNIRKVV